MLSGSAILRVAVLLVVAALLAGALQWYWWSPASEAPMEAAPAQKPVSRPVANPARQPQEPLPPRAETAPQRAEAPPQPMEPAAPAAPRAPEPAPSPPPVAAPPPVFEPPPRSAAEIGQGAIDSASESAGPRALAIVDLNTASLSELNKLKGGGAIGKAIIARRPYASVDQLLSKRVLNRATYERIKEQVTAR